MEVFIYLHKDNSVECLKTYPTGLEKHNVFADYSECYSFIKDCNVIFFGEDFKKLLKLFRDYEIDYNFTTVSLINIQEVEEYINPKDLFSISLKYAGDKEDGLKAISDIYSAQKSILNTTTQELDKISNKGLKRIDSEGWIIEKDGVLLWNEGKRKGKPIIEDLDYATYIMNNTDFNDLKRILKKAFKR